MIRKWSQVIERFAAWSFNRKQTTDRLKCSIHDLTRVWNEVDRRNSIFRRWRLLQWWWWWWWGLARSFTRSWLWSTCPGFNIRRKMFSPMIEQTVIGWRIFRHASVPTWWTPSQVFSLVPYINYALAGHDYQLTSYFRTSCWTRCVGNPKERVSGWAGSRKCTSMCCWFFYPCSLARK